VKKKFVLEIFGILIAFFGLLAFIFWPDPCEKSLCLSILDVGQGDAIFVRTDDGQKILIDTGADGRAVIELGGVLGMFEREIDLLVLTHPDLDHIGGAVDVLERYDVGQILLTGVAHETAAYSEVLRLSSEKKIPVIPATTETAIEISGETEIEILWPQQNLIGKNVGDLNETSIVLRVDFGQTSAILTGDIGVETERELIENGAKLQADILKLGHHGASTSSSEKFVAAVNPSIVLISAGKDNKFGHPTPEVLARVEEKDVIETSKSGTVTLIFDGGEKIVRK